MIQQVRFCGRVRHGTMDTRKREFHEKQFRETVIGGGSTDEKRRNAEADLVWRIRLYGSVE